MTKPAGHFCKLALKTTEENDKEMQEVTASRAVAAELRVDVAAWSV